MAVSKGKEVLTVFVLMLSAFIICLKCNEVTPTDQGQVVTMATGTKCFGTGEQAPLEKNGHRINSKLQYALNKLKTIVFGTEGKSRGYISFFFSYFASLIMYFSGAFFLYMDRMGMEKTRIELTLIASKWTKSYFLDFSSHIFKSNKEGLSSFFHKHFSYRDLIKPSAIFCYPVSGKNHRSKNECGSGQSSSRTPAHPYDTVDGPSTMEQSPPSVTSYSRVPKESVPKCECCDKYVPKSEEGACKTQVCGPKIPKCTYCISKTENEDTLDMTSSHVTSNTSSTGQVTSQTATGPTQNGKTPSGNGARPKTSTQATGAGESSARLKGDLFDTTTVHNFQYWVDTDTVASESYIAEHQADTHPEPVWNLPLDDLIAHGGFIPIASFLPSHIPQNLRSKELYELITCLARLTVRVKVRQTSSFRPENDPYHEWPNSARYGTGFAYDESECDILPPFKEDGTKSQEKKPKTGFAHVFSSKPKYYFSVVTNRHVVYDDIEAFHTEVTFEFPAVKRGQTVKYKAQGVSVIHGNEEGIYSTLLICKTSKFDLIERLNDERKRFADHRQNLTPGMQEKLVEKCFAISHPYGQQKMVTFGNATVIKYVLCNRAGGGKRQIERYSTLKRGSNEDMRETLMYTAGTSNGSSGAPIFTCRNTRQGPRGDLKLHLTTWIHNGVDKETLLSCSVMKAYSPELTESKMAVGLLSKGEHGSRSSLSEETPTPNKETPKPNKEMPDAGQSLGSNSKANSSSKTSTSSPVPGKPVALLGPVELRHAYMAARLETFKFGYKSDCKHSPVELAALGFYYAGFGDLIKCFCCGLGLKGWKADNDVYVEHERHKANCPYFKAHKDSRTPIDPTLLFDETDDEDKEEAVTLLKTERKRLKESLMCKVCWQQPASELFLPCADVIVCEVCSSFLYSCPLCFTDIHATVTVYLS